MATEIRLDKLRCQFGQVVAVDDISVTFPASSVTCLLGPSGCGKTTLMRMLAGLQMPTSGDIYFGDERVTDLTPSERNVGMVFQYPVVYRGTTVYRSVELPLTRDRTLSRRDRQQRIERVLETLDLAAYAQRDVSSLDNATRQKAAVARAVARQPHIILFDEPITNVDVNAKAQLKRALKTLVKQHAQTIIYVTHDQTEAMTLADEIALMENGRIVQRGVPADIYNQPNNRFGGWFLGNPGMNFIPSPVQHSDGRALLLDPLFKRPVYASGLNGSGEVVVGIRPERVQVGAETPTSIKAEVIRTSIVAGGQHLLTLRLGETVLKAKTAMASAPRPGTWVEIDCPLEHIILFNQGGERLEAALERGE